MTAPLPASESPGSSHPTKADVGASASARTAVPTTPPSTLTTARHLGLIVLLILVTRGWVFTHTEVPSRDCLIFSRYALHLEDPPIDLRDPQKKFASAREVVKWFDHPPGFAFLISVFSQFGRPTDDAELGPFLMRTAQMISIASAILMIFPAYSLVRRLFGATTAFHAVLIFAVIPGYAEVTSDGISDGVFLLTAVSALWFGVDSLLSGGWKRPALSGLMVGVCCGAGYYVRPDTLFVIAGVGSTYILTCIFRCVGRRSWKGAFLAGVGMGIGFAAAISPLVAITGRLTNKPTGNGVLDSIKGNEIDRTYFEKGADGPKPANVLLAAWWSPTLDAHEDRKWWAIRNLTAEVFKAGLYVIPGLAIIGLWSLRKRPATAATNLLLVQISVHLAVLWLMAWKVGYVSQRHTLLSVFICSIFAALALELIGALASRVFRVCTPSASTAIWVAVIVVGSMVRDFRTLHADRTGHKQAGQWIAANAPATAPVVDPFGWAEFYAGRTLRGWSHDDPRVGDPIYAIVEPNAKSHHSRLPRLEPARNLAAQGEMVWQYPADAPWDKVRVAVFRCRPLK